MVPCLSMSVPGYISPSHPVHVQGAESLRTPDAEQKRPSFDLQDGWCNCSGHCKVHVQAHNPGSWDQDYKAQQWNH